MFRLDAIPRPQAPDDLPAGHALVQAMQAAGFGKTTGGIVSHDTHGDFYDWTDAAVFCIGRVFYTDQD